MSTLYLAGFDVFRTDAGAHGERLKALCAEHGHQGLFPLDNAAPAGLEGLALARWIYEANVALIRRADVVVANVNNFRGAEPDSGTAFEIGFAAALGKPVWAYADDGRALVQQVACQLHPQGLWLDGQGLIVEDFGLARNLMIACAATLVQGDLRACLQALAQRPRPP
jgi:nucleoside 2-deoxyribosyltransferase